MTKHANLNDKITSFLDGDDVFEKKITKYYDSFIIYSDSTYKNVLEIEIKDIELDYYDLKKYYYAKDIGFIGSINKNCLNSEGVVKDNLTTCNEVEIIYEIKND